MVLIYNVATYASCITSVNGKDQDAKKLYSEVLANSTTLSEQTNSMNLITSEMNSDVLQKFLDHDVLKDSAYKQRSEDLAQFNLGYLKKIWSLR